jgi:hypothetical protein
VRDPHRRLLTLQLAYIDVFDEPTDTLSTEIIRRLATVSGDEPLVMAPEPTSQAGRPTTSEPAGAP